MRDVRQSIARNLIAIAAVRLVANRHCPQCRLDAIQINILRMARTARDKSGPAHESGRSALAGCKLLRGGATVHPRRCEPGVLETHRLASDRSDACERASAWRLR